MKAKHLLILLLTGCILYTGCGEKQEINKFAESKGGLQ